MFEWITNTIATFNYWGIALLMFLENVLPPIPSELIMPLAGFTVAQGKLNFFGVVLAGTIGSIAGTVPWYYLGRHLGEKRLRKWVERRGQWLALSGEDIDKSKRWFDKYGGPVVLFGRLIPGIRTFISVPAGFEEIPWLKFLVYSVIGTMCWNLLLVCAGIFLRENYRMIEDVLGPVSGIVLACLLLGAGIWIVQRKR